MYMEHINEFSVVIIAYNNIHELNVTLSSLNNLHYPRSNFEVIVVDDGSYPPLHPSLQIEFNFSIKFSYIPRTNTSSRSKARNKGASIAINKYLIFIDGDQYVNPELLSRYNQAIKENDNIDAFLGTRIDLTEWQTTHLLENKNYEQLIKITRSQYDIRHLVKVSYGINFPKTYGVWILFWSHNFLIKKDVFIAIEGFDENFIYWGCEDVELGYKLSKNNFNFDFIENHVFHLYEPNKFTSLKYFQSLQNLQYFYDKYKDIAIMFKLGFYESFYSPDINKIHQETVLSAFKIFNKKIVFLKDMESAH